MKKIALLFVAVATMFMTSCGGLKSTTTQNAAATAAGSACGAAVSGLYKSYKATGNINLATTNDLTNALAVATAYSQLRANSGNAAYKKAFAAGLVAGSAGTITTATATSFMNSLLATAGLAGVNANNIASKVETASAIVTLLRALN